eukprot:m.541686 g.541686  ORF g.541686 m.541686 type:complete len:78 (-) comp22111_c1_seq11:1285-1518(-)
MQQAVATAQVTFLQPLLWLGGVFVNGSWYWPDGSSVDSGFTYWGAGQGIPATGEDQPYMCYLRASGQWHVRFSMAYI